MRRAWLISVRWLVLVVALGTATWAHASLTSTVDLVMSDGTHLRTDIYAVAGEPAPVILVRTPYGRTAMGPVADELRAKYNATIFVQDIRGRGESEGVDSVFRDDAADGRETLEWKRRRGYNVRGRGYCPLLRCWRGGNR